MWIGQAVALTQELGGGRRRARRNGSSTGGTAGTPPPPARLPSHCCQRRLDRSLQSSVPFGHGLASRDMPAGWGTPLDSAEGGSSQLKLRRAVDVRRVSMSSVSARRRPVRAPAGRPHLVGPPPAFTNLAVCCSCAPAAPACRSQRPGQRACQQSPQDLLAADAAARARARRRLDAQRLQR